MQGVIQSMKKTTLLLLLIFLTGCQGPMQAFTFNEQCSHVCWLGINPGSTTAEQAQALLRSADRIDQKSFQDVVDSTWLDWYPGQKNLPCMVNITREQGVVKTISISSAWMPFTMDDFVSRIGEPDEISIEAKHSTHSDITAYMVYFSSIKAIIYVVSDRIDSPGPRDIIQDLELNIDVNDKNVLPLIAYMNENRQPWLGYGHREEYLSGVNIPPHVITPVIP